MARTITIASSQSPATFSPIVINDAEPTDVDGYLSEDEVVSYAFRQNEIVDYMESIYAVSAKRLSNGQAWLSSAGSRVIIADANAQLCLVTDADGAESKSDYCAVVLRNPRQVQSQVVITLVFHKCTVLKQILSTDKQVI